MANVDWSQIKSIKDLKALGDSLYDDTPDGEDFYGVTLNPELSEDEIEDAAFWARFSRGVILISGGAGSGKGLVGTMMAWKMKRYFGKRVMLDYKPRSEFGEYMPFNDRVFVEDLKRMSDLAGWENTSADVLEDKTAQWIATKGQVFLHNSVLTLDEFKRYHYKRNPHLPINKVLGQLYDVFRHLDLLVIGMAIDRNELDQYTCIPKLTAEIRTQWSMTQPNTCIATLYPLRYIGTRGVLSVEGKPIRLLVDGKKPRPQLGGKCWFDLYRSKNPVAMSTPKSMSPKQQ